MTNENDVVPLQSPTSIEQHSPSDEEPSLQTRSDETRVSDENQNAAASATEDYNSILSEFDEFAASESSSSSKSESVGHGYKIGDMVWGKVKSHPWWPGHIYNESFASPSVRRSKSEGHVLVAFFGDNSYGWFDPAELVPFEENFVEKCRQTNLRSFSKAVEEAVDELSRRSSLGLACRCRNEYNFWPSSVESHFVVDFGDYERGIYSESEISKARDDFRPSDMLSFVRRLALAPMDINQHSSMDFIKNKAVSLACRKALFEEFDETYAQAFGSTPVRPSRPTAPLATDLSKAPLSGPLVIAEALSKGKTSVKPTKTKDQVEKDKYLFKRRDEQTKTKSKKAGSSKSSHPALVDGSGFSEKTMHHTSESGVGDDQNQASKASDIRPLKGAKKKAKVPKRPAGELSVETAKLIEKKKKKRKTEVMPETGGQLPAAVSNSTIAMDNLKKDTVDVCSSSQLQKAVDFDKVELQMLVRDLRALALNPTHGHMRDCPSVIRQVFLKYRSHVYQKSLLLSPPHENEANEGNSSRLPATTTVTAEKTKNKIIKPSVRLDDPTKGGRKRVPSDHPENVKKKKKTDDVAQEFKKKKNDNVSQETKKKKNDNVSQETKKKKKTDDVTQEIKKKKSEDQEIKKMKKIDGFDEVQKKKKLDDSKLLELEKKITQRSTDSHLKETAARNATPQAVKLESSKKMMQTVKGGANPTMLVMKFPGGAALPSGAELRAKFARFGPLDHSATRVFWKSYTCRLVYHHRIDAEAALSFANASGNLFGNGNVRSYVREVGAEGAESEPTKLQKEEISQPSNRIAAQPIQRPQNVQLKSILKKSSGDEGGNGGGRGGTRVKFVLEGNESSIEGEKLHFNSDNNKNKSIATFPEVVDINNKNLPKFIPQSSISVGSTSTSQFPINMPSFEQGPRPSMFNVPPKPQPINDVSQEMLNLLTRCSDVVNNLTGVLGYVPYHPL